MLTFNSHAVSNLQHRFKSQRKAPEHRAVQVLTFNGHAVNNLKHMVALIEDCKDEFFKFELAHDTVLVLDAAEARASTAEMLRVHNIPQQMSADLLNLPRGGSGNGGGDGSAGGGGNGAAVKTTEGQAAEAAEGKAGENKGAENKGKLQRREGKLQRRRASRRGGS